MNFFNNAPAVRHSASLFLLRVLTVFMVLTGLSSTIKAQSDTYTFSFKNKPLDQVIAEVAKKSGYEFVFDAAYLKDAKPITAEIAATTIDKVLERVFRGQNFSYEISRKTIILKPKEAVQEVYQVRGKVIDSLGAAIPGAIVRLKGATIGTQTDGEGKFVLNVATGNSTVVFSYMGYTAREFDVSPAISASNISIVLKPAQSLLNEVFVNGFQTISKERAAAAYTIVNNKELNRQINVDLLSALEGRVAGLVYVKNPNGAAADQPVLRGISTMSSEVGTSPLIVIDGLPTEYTLDEVNPYDIESVTVLKDAAAASIYGSRSANGVIVLTTKQGKGSGVQISLNADLFVTGKPDLSKMHYASTSDLIDFETDVYNAERSRYSTISSMFAPYGTLGGSSRKYYSPLYELYRLQELGTVSADEVNNTLTQWRQNDYMNEYSDQVWQNEVRQRYNLSLSSNTDKNNTYLSLNYDQGKGRVINNINKSLNLNMKSTFKFKSWLTATFGLNGTYANDKATDGDYNNFEIQPRYARILDAQGNRVTADYVGIDDGFTSGGAINGALLAAVANNTNLKSFGFNVLDALDEGIATTKYTKLRTFANIEAKLYKGLSISTQFQYENSSSDAEQYYEANSYKMRYAYNIMTTLNSTTGKYDHALPEGGRYYQFNKSSNNYTFRNQLNFNRGFGKDQNEHYVAAVAGFEMRQTFIPRTLEQLRYGYDPVTLSSTNLDYATLGNAGVATYLGGTRTLGTVGRTQSEIKHRYLSYYSNMSYTYQGKYNLTGSIRVDQADLFGVDPKYKNRPLWSLGGSWNASSEDFLKDLKWLSSLKARLTYGINGNVDQGSSPYLVARRRNDVLYPALQYLDITTLPNPMLRWEKTATTNFGIDYAMFDSRLRGSVDIYNRNSSDLLVTTDLDPTVGATSRVLNNGALRNRGLEWTVSGDWFKTKDWTITSAIVVAFNKNEVMKVNNAATTGYSYIGSPTDYFFQNTPFNSLYAYKYGGMVNGYPYFLNEKGEPNVTFDASGTPTAITAINSPDALVRVGQLNPKYNGSFSQRISYKQFELGALLVFSGGNQLRKDVTALDADDVNDEDITRRWNSSGTSDLPRLLLDYPQAWRSSAGTLSSLWQYSDKQVVDADYVKLRNVSLSYSLPKRISRKMNVSAVKLTGQVNNLWYWSAAGDDIDPETYSLNSGTRAYSIPKSFLLGFNITF